MEKTLSLLDLKKEYLMLEMIECHRQTWTKKVWNGYKETPRFADAFLIICSDIKLDFFVGEERTLSAKRGDCIYIPKGICYSVEFSDGGRGVDLYTINFLLKDTNGAEIRFGEDIRVLTENTSPECYRLVFELAEAYITFERDVLKMQALMFSLFNAIVQAKESASQIYNAIRKGTELLESEWNRNYEIKRYASMCGMSETNFYMYFKEWSGVSPVRYRNGMRISAAKSLLLNSNIPISEISSRVGFDDQYYFSRIFKKMIGVSPRQYRQGI